MTEVEAQEAQREATATIRGYMYQFDASILAVLGATKSESITVEGVEDFDVLADEIQTYGQVKYYEAQKLTDSTLRDAILPMITGFLRYPADVRLRKKYVLYGYFKDSAGVATSYGLADMQRVLVRAQYAVDPATGSRVKTTINLQTDLGASDEDLAVFCGRFTVVLSEPFDMHRARVIEALRAALEVAEDEASLYSYPSAFSAMASLSAASSKAARTTTRKDFLQQIQPNVAVYSAWALRRESEAAYCKLIREAHFARLNVENHDRFFIIDLPDTETLDMLITLVRHIIGGWSSHRSKSKPAKERYAPFFFFPGIDPADLVELKSRLIGESYRITDGYAFFGAPFTTQQLLLAQTAFEPIAARIVGDAAQLAAALDASVRRRLVVQLHAGKPQAINAKFRQISVPVRSAAMAMKIV
ncbi:MULTISPECIES: hypothetical protein [unclassified Sphingomonas]|uniref:hypothetical protein n=1 Tax=unclassified Sphingomonas TaxID=196159 RepID=UPI0006FFF291|nr:MULTISPECIES: hypothetical protein [unclassified Sphingomonas]KQM62634.1 hypothetical protein ASE65_17790 [Sphingomonas sp. Leaf16]KQM88548.1 hypothetical protein ASE67_02025 [Sphingomonas sp. Leaf23]KQN14885.1 hypothetical protein ASE81_17805 [Sphingomonas sp. Leaf29]KQN20418.1 hypothetical protein ASE83_17775 [Sphingomonas sp. Leaf32]